MLFKNTAAQSADLLTAYVFSLLLAPVMLDRLGLAQFGVWAVTGAMATYAGLADFGITRSLSRFIALYDVAGDRRGVGESITLGLLATTAVTAAAALLAVLGPSVIAGGLGVISPHDLRLVLLCSVAIYAFTTYRRVLNSVAVGLRRMVPSNVANVFTNSLNFVFSLGALLIHPSLVTYGAANAASYLVGVGAAYVGVRHIWGSLPLAWPSRSRAGTILSFGVKTQLHAFADLVNVQADKIVLAFLVGVRAAASYEIAARVVMAVRAVGMLTISAMIPTVAAHIAEHGREALPRLYRRYTRLTVGLSFPVFVLACVTAPFLMKAWLDQVPPRAPGTVVVISLAYLAPLSCIVAMNIATADGRPGFVASNSLITAALNVGLTLILAPVLGFWGVLGGTALALAFGSALFVARFHRSYRLPLADYVRAAGPPAALAIGLGGVIGVWELMLGWGGLARGSSLVVVAGLVAAYGAVYWPLASRLGFLPDKLALPVTRRLLARHS